MFTAEDAQNLSSNNLDDIIQEAVVCAVAGDQREATIWVRDSSWFADNIAEELEKRRFHNISVQYERSNYASGNKITPVCFEW